MRMSYSFCDAAVCQGPWVEMAKYSSPHWKSGLQPGASGLSPIDWSCGASDVVPTYFRSAACSSLAWMQPVVRDALQLGRAPLVAWSSNPDTIESIEVRPLPCPIPWPLSGNSAVWIAPPGIRSDVGWVMAEAGRGAE